MKYKKKLNAVHVMLLKIVNICLLNAVYNLAFQIKQFWANICFETSFKFVSFVFSSFHFVSGLLYVVGWGSL